MVPEDDGGYPLRRATFEGNDYALYGWRVRADTALEPVTVPGQYAEPNLYVSAHGAGPVPSEQPNGVVLAEFPHCEACPKTYWLVANEDGFLIRFPGEVEYHISKDVKYVYWKRSPGVTLEHARELFRGHGMALLLGLAGHAVFHASGVLLANPSGGTSKRAIAFIGGTGAGKSSLAALSVAAGAKFLTDDLLCAVPTSDGIVVTGGCAELRLRRQARHLAGLFPGSHARTTLDDRLALVLEEGGLAATSLGLLVFPIVSDETTEITVHALTPREVVVQLVGFPRMSGWLAKPVLETQLCCLAKMANEVTAIRLEVPWSDTLGPVEADALIGQLGAAMWRATSA